MKKLILFLIANAVVINFAFSQAAINSTGNPAHASAMLDVSSTNSGILIPRMTEAQKIAIISPALGLMIYQTDNASSFWYYNGTEWVQAIGPIGPTGTAGTNGSNGTNGVAGATGTAGTNGTNGVTGETGPTGTAGTNGSNGINGVTGSTGPTGPNYTYYIGELTQGGVVFYVDQTGNHGLICSMVDISTSDMWIQNYQYTVTAVPTCVSCTDCTSSSVGAQSDWNGACNTNAIINQGATSGAAYDCTYYTNASYDITGTHSDWYLPGLRELNLLYVSLYQVQKGISGYSGVVTPIPTVLQLGGSYWSSTEADAEGAVIIACSNGWPSYYSKRYTAYVRAVRAF